MPEPLPTVYEDPAGNIYPARVVAVDQTDDMAFIEYFSVSLWGWLTGWKPISSLWL